MVWVCATDWCARTVGGTYSYSGDKLVLRGFPISMDATSNTKGLMLEKCLVIAVKKTNLTLTFNL